MTARATSWSVRGPLLVALVLVLLISLRLGTGSLPSDLLPAALRDAGTLAAGVFLESFPFVVLGAAVSTAVQLWVPQKVFFKVLPKNPIARRCALSLLGVILPVCECGNVPLARGLLQRGFSPAESLTFVLAAPLLNPVTIITTYQAFGFEDGILFARILGGFVIANLVGLIASAHPHQDHMLQPRFAASCAHSHTSGAKQGTVQRGAGMFASEMVALLPALAIGSLLAGLIQVGISQDTLLSLGTHPVWSVVTLIALAGIVSICSTVDAFFMLAFAGVFLPGGIVAFLVFGAMIDVKMLVLLRTTYRPVTLVWVTLAVLFGSLALGFGVNLVA